MNRDGQNELRFALVVAELRLSTQSAAAKRTPDQAHAQRARHATSSVTSACQINTDSNGRPSPPSFGLRVSGHVGCDGRVDEPPDACGNRRQQPSENNSTSSVSCSPLSLPRLLPNHQLHLCDPPPPFSCAHSARGARLCYSELRFSPRGSPHRAPLSAHFPPPTRLCCSQPSTATLPSLSRRQRGWQRLRLSWMLCSRASSWAGERRRAGRSKRQAREKCSSGNGQPHLLQCFSRCAECRV